LGGETGTNNQAYHIKGFAPKGQTPTVPSFPETEKINMVSAINNQGSCIFHIALFSLNQSGWIFKPYPKAEHT